MNRLTKAYVRLTEPKRQPVTKSALIRWTIAVVAFLTYGPWGNSIGALLNSVIADQ